MQAEHPCCGKPGSACSAQDEHGVAVLAGGRGDSHVGHGAEPCERTDTAAINIQSL